MSALLSASDLNDFISPGLACIKPVKEAADNNTETNDDNEEYGVQINAKGAQSTARSTTKELPSASISLQDCLACSGCITSAEEVLLAKQTHTILLEDLKNFKDEKCFVFSISHQSRISMSLYLGLPVSQFDQFIIRFMKEKYGFQFAVGTELGRVLSINQIDQQIIAAKQSEKGIQLSSVCPGFVLYVEKTKPEILPYLLNVKSPQQLTGLLLKTLLSKELGRDLTDIYHLSIMPCFDKKLESARPELVNEVDCVLTPREMVELIKESNVNIQDYIFPSQMDRLYQQSAPREWPCPSESWSSNLGSASGGFAWQYILSLQVSNSDLKTDIKEIKGKNSDVVEYHLLNSETGEKIGSSAVVNGFKNIQNLVRKLKPSGKVKVGSGIASRRRRRGIAGKSTENTEQPPEEAVVVANPTACDFVEVMACPGGCINGGGLLETEVNREGLITKYNGLPQIERLQDVQVVNGVLNTLKKYANLDSSKVFSYEFTKIEKLTDVVSVGNKW
ncbi:hypothetical protein WICPIJ_001290 [Wickerhamomyces pijperi]|uniref:Cytosolic Fe-S cluster assembly factor NAR1 n=1 Tax=Wickerhamomyces pijperi TaxID=599730 RepID=A0A9P8TQX8_WICPI|nr:hypothetical protein WICPIJ_001290 [Wickerhamomyces pijperi]